MARQEPSLAKPLREGDRAGVLDATMDLLSGSLRSTVVVIEDTQWADEATLDAIKFLGRRIAGTNGLLVLTYRDGEVDLDHPLRGVIGDLPPQSVARIQLSGLSLAAVSSIVGEYSLDPDEILAATNGNPLLVSEMAASEGKAVPSSVQDSAMARVRKLSLKAQQTVRTLSVIPKEIAVSEVFLLTDAHEEELAEAERRGLLEVGVEIVAFRHELIRRAIEASLPERERAAANRTVLELLPPETDPARLVHHASEANETARLIELAPRAASAGIAVGSHREAVAFFRLLSSHLDRLEKDIRGNILEDWAQEEYLADNLDEAIRLNDLALVHYREAGDKSAQSRVLTASARSLEAAGQRSEAEQLARQAVEVLGRDPDSSDLARALEVNTYVAVMGGNVTLTPELVDRTLRAAGSDADEWIIVRSLGHKAHVANISNYPDGRVIHDEARERSEAAGLWFEEARSLVNHAWAAAEFRDLGIASDYAQRSIASAVRHDLAFIESYAKVIYARVLDLKGEWNEAEDLARDQLDRSPIAQMVALPILGAIEARTGRDTAAATLTRAWEMAVVADEFHRLAHAAIGIAEYAWVSGRNDISTTEFGAVLEAGLDLGFEWSTGSLALWLWKLGAISKAPEGIAEPYRMVIEGETLAAAEAWAKIGCPYDRAIALTHGDQTAQLEALEILDMLGATAVAARLRQALRNQGISVPRGVDKRTRAHAAGLTARQAEVLQLLDQGLSNNEIADRLFVSERTVETHVSAILAKLEAKTRGEAVTRARAAGLLTIGGPRTGSE